MFAVEEPDAVLLPAVDVAVQRKPALDPGRDERQGQRVDVPRCRDRDGAACPVPLRPAELVVLAAPETRKHVAPAPAVHPRRGPRVVVEWMSPKPRHVVDGPAAAHGTPRGDGHLTMIELHLGNRGVAPVGSPSLEPEHPERNRHGGVRFASARLQDQDVAGRVLTQPGRHHGPCRAATDDDVVEARLRTCTRHVSVLRSPGTGATGGHGDQRVAARAGGAGDRRIHMMRHRLASLRTGESSPGHNHDRSSARRSGPLGTP
jgi:hypothetical protein